MRPFHRSSHLALLGFALFGCGGGQFVWFHDLPAAPAAGPYVIASGDLLGVRIFNQDNMSTHARVRSDGRIAVPFLGDVEVSGKTPDAVSRELGARFKEYVVAPTVTITVEESHPTSVSVLGEVAHPGTYTVEASSGVLQALAGAGGFTDYASRDAIYVLRRSPEQRIRFTYSALIHSEPGATTFRLHPGDVLVVE
jgi:polysaccharide export outer membrane protein